MAVIAGKTISKVVQDGLCTGCGTCVGICPKDAIQMVKDESKGIYLPQLDGAKCSECGICLKACPGCEVDFKTLAIEIFSKEPEDILLGNYLSCYIGHATDYDIRYNSASGGLVTALLIYALEEGIIDGALVTKMSKDDPLQPQPFIARTREEIISASKSKYCPVPANIALNEIVNAKEGERFAVVGLPCHIQGIRKAELVDNKLKDRIALHLGLFCNHTPSFLATEYILSKKKIKREDVRRLDYRGEGWPGFMKIDAGEKPLFFLIHDYWASGFGSFFYPLRCALCCDQSSELADISFGDAWLPELSDDKVGSSMVISRSEIGAEILQRAAAKGKITLNKIPVRKVVETQWAGLHFKKTVEARISLLRVTGRKEMPAYSTKLLKPGFRSRVDAILLFSRRYAASKRHLWRIIYLWCFLKSLPIKVLKMVGLYKTAAVLRRKLIKFSQ